MKKISILLLPILLSAAPNKPSDINLIASKNSVNISWQDNSADERGFKIFRDGEFIGLVPANTTSFVDKGLRANSRYRYEIRATDDRENLVNSITATSSNKLLTIEINGRLKTDAHASFFIDSDNNPDTGYTRGDIVGIDYLVDGRNLYSYGGIIDGRKWNWDRVTTINKYELTSTKAIFEVPLNKINVETDIKYIAEVSSGDWNKRTDYSSMQQHSMDMNEFLTILKKSDGVEIKAIKSSDDNILVSGSKIFDLDIEELSSKDKISIDSLQGWESVEVDKNSSQISMIFSNPKDNQLPKTLKVLSTIELDGEKSKWNIEVLGVGSRHSIIDIDAPKLRFKIMENGKFLIPKYTGKIIDVENETIDRDMLYPAGWQSTMQFLAYYNDKSGLYLGNHDPKASTKRFRVLKKDGVIEYSTNIIPPNKTLADNNFKLSGVFELDSFNGDWFDASKIYEAWASEYAEYWPKMTSSRKSRQHSLGEVALWIGSTYISAIDDSDRTQESKDRHKKNYLNNIKSIILNDIIVRFPDVGIGFFWHEWYGELHDTNFPSVFFPNKDHLTDIKSLIQEIKQSHPKFQFMPYINGLLYNKYLPDFENSYSLYALKQLNGNYFEYLPRGNVDLQFPERQFVRMDPTSKPWQDLVANAAKVSTVDIDSDGVNIDQVTASNVIEDMDKTHNHPIAGGHWWRDGYASMFETIDSKIGNKYVTSEGANEFLSDHIDGFFVHWDGINNMVPAYQSIYSGKMQLFGLNMNTGSYDRDRFYMMYAQAFTSGIGLGIVTSWIAQDTRPGASTAFSYLVNLATMKYKLREFLSYGKMQRDIKIIGDVPTLSDDIVDHGMSSKVFMSAVQHSVYKNETEDKIAFIFTNASRSESINFSFEIDPNKYLLVDGLKVKQMSYIEDKDIGTITGKTIMDVNLKPLESQVFILSH